MLPDQRRRDAAWRIAIVAVATVAAALSWPAAVRTTLTVLAVVAVADALVRRRRLGWQDALLVGTAGLVTGLVLLGLVLNLLPAGLARVPWAVGAGLLGLTAVIRTRTGLAPKQAALPRPSRRDVLRGTPWVIAAVLVTVTAVLVSVRATDIANRPAAQLSEISRSAAGALVQVDGGPGAGRYQLVIRSSGSASRIERLDLPEGQHARYRIVLATTDSTEVQLRVAGTRDVAAALILRPTTTDTP